MQMAGQTGELRVGGRKAGRLGPWQLEGDSNGWQLQTTGPVHCQDPSDFLLGQAETSGVELRLDVGTHVWRWRGVQLLHRHPVVAQGQGRPEIL